MTKSEDIITFEDFTGVDLTSSALGRNPAAAISLVNMEKLENGTLRGRQGCHLAAQPLFMKQIFKYIYTDEDGAVQQELIGVGCANPLSVKGGQLYRLRSNSLTVTYAGADPFWDITLFPVEDPSDDIDDSYMSFNLTSSSGSSNTTINLGSGYLPDPITLIFVTGTIDALADFSCFPDNTAIVNGNQTGAKTVTVNSGHTIEVGDWVSFKNRATVLEEYREVIATTATTITFNSLINFNWNDDDVIGHGRFPAAILKRRVSGGNTASSIDLDYTYWEPIPMSTNRNDLGTTNDDYVFSDLSLNPGKAEFLQPSFVNKRNCCYVTANYAREYRVVTSFNEGLGEGTRRVKLPYFSGLWKYDGYQFYLSGFPPTDASGMAVTNSGGGALAAGSRVYRVSYVLTDAQGNEIEWFNFSSNLHNGNGDASTVTLQSPSGSAYPHNDKFNLRSAVADGAHSSGATIDVDADHLLRTGDWVFFTDSSGNEHKERVTGWTNTSVTLTTETISGSDHDLDDNAIISTCRGRLWRTTAGGAEYYFHSSFEIDITNTTSIVITDDTADTDLGYSIGVLEPENIQYNFPKGNVLASHQGSLCVGGGSRIPNQVHWEDATSPESSSRAFDNLEIPGDKSGDINVLVPSDDDALIAIKPRAKYGIYGNLPGREYEILRISENGFGAESTQGVEVYENATMGISPLGIWASDVAAVGEDIGQNLLPLFRDSYRFGGDAATFRTALKRSICAYDEKKNWIHVLLPIENSRTDNDVTQYYLSPNSKYYVFMISQVRDMASCWSEFRYDVRQLPNGGMETVDGDFYGQTYLWDEDLDYWTGFLHRRSEQVTPGFPQYDFVDHVKSYNWELVPQWIDAGTPQQNKTWGYFTLYSLQEDYRISDNTFTVEFESYRDWFFSNLKTDTVRDDSLVFDINTLEAELKFDAGTSKAKRRTFKLSGTVFGDPALITGYNFSFHPEDYKNNRVAKPSVR